MNQAIMGCGNCEAVAATIGSRRTANTEAVPTATIGTRQTANTIPPTPTPTSVPGEWQEIPEGWADGVWCLECAGRLLCPGCVNRYQRMRTLEGDMTATHGDRVRGLHVCDKDRSDTRDRVGHLCDMCMLGGDDMGLRILDATNAVKPLRWSLCLRREPMQFWPKWNPGHPPSRAQGVLPVPPACANAV